MPYVKDAVDGLALLAAYPLANFDPSGISLPRILAFTSSDWGWWRMLTGNVAGLGQLLQAGFQADGALPGPADRSLAGPARAHAKRSRRRPEVACVAPRGRIGDQLQWCDEPEEVRPAT